MNKNIDTMENDWLYEFQKHIKNFLIVFILILLLLLIIFVIY